MRIKQYNLLNYLYIYKSRYLSTYIFVFGCCFLDSINPWVRPMSALHANYCTFIHTVRPGPSAHSCGRSTIMTRTCYDVVSGNIYIYIYIYMEGRPANLGYVRCAISWTVSLEPKAMGDCIRA